MSLLPKRERFCWEYVIDHNGTLAAERAGYSKKSAYSQASALLKDPKVAARIAELEKTAAEKAGVTLQRVIDRLALFAFTNLDEVVDMSGAKPRIKSLLEMDDPGKRSIISEVSETSTGLLRIKTHSAQAALETLKSILTGPADVRLQLSGEVIQRIERIIIDPKGKK